MNTLSTHPPEAVQIGTSCFSLADVDGQTVYFSNMEPFDCHDEGDRPAMLLRIARFAKHGVPQRDLQAAFGVSRATVQRAVKKLRDRGEASFHEPRRGRGISVFTGETADAANRLLAEGMSAAALARELGIARSTVYYNLNNGFIGGGERPQPEAAKDDEAARCADDLLGRGERNRRDRVGRVRPRQGP